MKTQITEIVYQCLKDLNLQIGSAELENPTSDTRLYGAKSEIDSIHLVILIADLEGRIAEVFGKDIILADERAMSLTRSPFGRAGTLVDYIEQLLSEPK